MLYAVANWSEVSVLLLWQEEDVSAGSRFIFWGYWSWMELFLLQKFMVCNYVGMCFSVPHCHQNVMPPVLSGICTYHTCLYCFQICFDVSVMWRLPQPSLDIPVFSCHPFAELLLFHCLATDFICNCSQMLSLFHSFPPLCPSFDFW